MKRDIQYTIAGFPHVPRGIDWWVEKSIVETRSYVCFLKVLTPPLELIFYMPSLSSAKEEMLESVYICEYLWECLLFSVRKTNCTDAALKDIYL